MSVLRRRTANRALDEGERGVHGERAPVAWAREEIAWGMCKAPEAEVRMLPDLEGKEVVELGCGTAYFGAWLKRHGAPGWSVSTSRRRS